MSEETGGGATEPRGRNGADSSAGRDAPRTGALPPEAASELDALGGRTDTDADPEAAGPRPHEGGGAGAGEGPTVRVEAPDPEEPDDAQSHPTLRGRD